tara:strand:- start:276 stop:818 length:543 start_codon:yes stop_codon:yes gene_type:complete
MSTLNVTNIKAADGTSGLSIANSTGLVTASAGFSNLKATNAGFKAFRSSDQTGFAPNNTGDYVVIYNDVSSHDGFNTGGHYSTSTGKFTAPVNGIYFFNGAAYSAATSFSQCWFVKNGARATGTDWHGGTNSNFQVAATILKLNANDTVGFHPYTNSSSSITINSNSSHTYFTGALLYEV